MFMLICVLTLNLVANDSRKTYYPNMFITKVLQKDLNADKCVENRFADWICMCKYDASLEGELHIDYNSISLSHGFGFTLCSFLYTTSVLIQYPVLLPILIN